MGLDGGVLPGFLAAAFLITLSPGPDNLMVLGLGMARGPKAGVAFGLGCAAGCLTHTAWAALGVGALVAASPSAMRGLAVAGGLYLLYLGVLAWRAAAPGAIPAALPDDPPARLFRRGFVANAVNPKVMLFFLAFLPHFVVPGAGAAPVAAQVAVLGLLFALQAAGVFAVIGWGAGRLGGVLRRRPWVGAALDRLAAAILVGLGLRLLLGA